jgi:hypothetical protein
MDPAIVAEYEALLKRLQSQKTGVRSEEQRRLAVAITELETSLLWYKSSQQ